MTVGGKVKSPVRFAENCVVDPCACVALFWAPAVVVVLVPVALFWAPAVVVVLVPVALFWAPAVVVVLVPCGIVLGSCCCCGISTCGIVLGYDNCYRSQYRNTCYEKSCDNIGYCSRFSLSIDIEIQIYYKGFLSLDEKSGEYNATLFVRFVKVALVLDEKLFML